MEPLLHIKPKESFNQEISKVFHFISLTGEANLVGSASYQPILYSSDYDLNEKDNMKLSKVVELFKKKFDFCEKHEDHFITDFKCGIKDGKSLRWSKADMKKGVNNGVTFREALCQKSMIKLDLAILINGSFCEFSEIYYIKSPQGQNYTDNELSREFILKSLLEDIEDQKKNRHWLKYTKRCFSYFLISRKKQFIPMIRKLIPFFNSFVGKIGKARSDLEFLILLLKNNNHFRIVKVQDIHTNIQIIKQSLANVFEVDLNHLYKEMDELCEFTSRANLIKDLEKVADYLNKLANHFAKQFIDKNFRHVKMEIKGGDMSQEDWDSIHDTIHHFRQQFPKNPTKGIALGVNAYESPETRKRRARKNIDYISPFVNKFIPHSEDLILNGYDNLSDLYS